VLLRLRGVVSAVEGGEKGGGGAYRSWGGGLAMVRWLFVRLLACWRMSMRTLVDAYVYVYVYVPFPCSRPSSIPHRRPVRPSVSRSPALPTSAGRFSSPESSQVRLRVVFAAIGEEDRICAACGNRAAGRRWKVQKVRWQYMTEEARDAQPVCDVELPRIPLRLGPCVGELGP